MNLKGTEIASVFNLSKKELFIIETILSLKEAKVAKLAKESSIPRQTLYSILERLQDLELVTESRVGRVKLYKTSINTLERALLYKQELIRKSMHNFRVEKENAKKKEVDNTNPKIAIYRGRPGISYILNEMTEIYRKQKFKTFRAYTMSQFTEGFEEEFKRFVTARHKAGVGSKIFVPRQTNFDKILGLNKFGREFKVLDMEDFGCALYIIGNRSYLVSYKDNEGFIIENNNLALFFKEIFDIHWNNSK